MDKCKHGRSRGFCCECRYGKNSRTASEGRTMKYERIIQRDITEIPVGERFMNALVRDDV